MHLVAAVSSTCDPMEGWCSAMRFAHCILMVSACATGTILVLAPAIATIAHTASVMSA